MRHAAIASPIITATILAATIVAALFAGGAAHASTIYKCTDAKGAVTMQNDTPCPPGTKQEVRQIGELPTAPAPTAQPAEARKPTAPPAGSSFELVRGPTTESLPESSVAKSERKPPPALFECKTWDNDTWLSETDSPEERCAPLTTTGLNGDPNLGMGAACEIKRDVCTALTEQALCSAWQRRIDEAKFRMTYAPAGEEAARKDEYDRRVAAFVDSSCR
ncbi:MAG: DUF4124 domain-containing protein [Lysobacter sp.]|nr:DUF4124 domain-containing protein [Lysobacter sp.]